MGFSSEWERKSEELCRELLRINKRPPKHKMELASILTELGTDQNLKFAERSTTNLISRNVFCFKDVTTENQFSKKQISLSNLEEIDSVFKEKHSRFLSRASGSALNTLNKQGNREINFEDFSGRSSRFGSKCVKP